MSEVIPQFVAHVSEDGERFESVLQHLEEVAELSSEFAAAFGGDRWGYALGLLHDIGKYSHEFQDRILRHGYRVDHSTAGASVMASQGHNPLLAYCIAGHHGGLPDGGAVGDIDATLVGRLRKAREKAIPPFEAYKDDVSVPDVPGLPLRVDQSRSGEDGYVDSVRYSMAFCTRMLFSCLVDADYLCTERFMQGKQRDISFQKSLADLCHLLEQRLAEFYPPQTPINALRCEVLDDCARMAASQPGVFSLTVPTGGGKTYALMRFALRHAVGPGRDFRRIICAEPYTSIIEQNAEVYRSVFEDGQVLEHHSNFDFSDHTDSDGNYDDVLRLASENWDAPIIVTTNVQLFESLHASKTSRCRKLHNIARSVIVLDEAQMIPVQFLRPCVRALAELVKNYGCTVVLCTATQPALNGFFEQEGLHVREIASDPTRLAKELCRVRYHNIGSLTDEELCERLAAQHQALCIVNNRRQAQALYRMMQGMAYEGEVFHLSTLMYPAHRSEVIQKIRQCLQEDAPCVVVATSVVEAGVDLDFGTVFRAMAGVDSLVQAAGRCNRNMRRSPDDSFVYLFESADCYAQPSEVSLRSGVTRGCVEALRSTGDVEELESLDTMQRYFSHLHMFKNLDAKGIVRELSTYAPQEGTPSISFGKVAEAFRLIADGSSNVIIPCAGNAADIEALCAGKATRQTMRRLSRYGVSVYQSDKKALYAAGAIKEVAEEVFVLLDASRYEAGVGLDLRDGGGKGVFL